jgi:hypothetical protein
MAYPGDPSSPDIGASTMMGGHGASDLAADDLERVAASFRPSWELDDAPFTGPATFSAAEVHALQNGEARQQVRKTLASSTNEAFAAPHRNDARRVSSIPPRPSRDVAMPALAPMRAPALSLDFEAQARQFRRRTPWLTVGAIGALVVGAGVWLASSGVAATPAPAAKATVAPVLEPPAPNIPPPPPVTAEAPRPSEPAAAPQASNEGVPPSPPLTTRASAPQGGPAAARASVPSALNVEARPPSPASAAPLAAGPRTPPPNGGSAAPARSAPVAKPAPRPKAAGGTIVRDVPF